jgi:hypothetical protein
LYFCLNTGLLCRLRLRLSLRDSLRFRLSLLGSLSLGSGLCLSLNGCDTLSFGLGSGLSLSLGCSLSLSSGIGGGPLCSCTFSGGALGGGLRSLLTPVIKFSLLPLSSGGCCFSSFCRNSFCLNSCRKIPFSFNTIRLRLCGGLCGSGSFSFGLSGSYTLSLCIGSGTFSLHALRFCLGGDLFSRWPLTYINFFPRSD